jgi:putative nucleotidyltransferase with HDIG domain
MKIERKFLKSKVARRIFAMFILCALVPISVLAILSFGQVRSELDKQNQRRLHQSTKALAMSIYEKLYFLENELKIFSLTFVANPKAQMLKPSERYYNHFKKRFKGLALVENSGEVISFLGQIRKPKKQSDEENKHLGSGKTLVLTLFDKGGRSRIYVMTAVNPKDPEKGRLVGEVNSSYLWGSAEDNTLPTMMELSIFDHSDRVIHSTIPVPLSFWQHSDYNTRRSSSGRLEWESEGRNYMANYRSVFLKYNYLYPKWTIVLSVPKDYILAPISFFKKIFPLVTLLAIWVVLLLSAIQIRRTTHPLEKLKEGTQRIAKKDFDSRVTVKSDDEFEELATSFNDMARQLGIQFKALTTMAEIDRAILSALDTEKIVDTLITRMHEVFSYDFVSVSLFNSNSENSSKTFIGSRDPNGVVRLVDDIAIKQDEVEKFVDNREIISINGDDGPPHFFTPFLKDGVESLVVLPLFLKQKPEGIITLGLRGSSEPAQEDLLQARQLADQVAVALSNAQLIEELDLLNWGTLTALARTVDAKSPWTAGHSERVTEIALKIGRVLGLSPDELENLHRGGLLHDIGKIGIPVSILDKPGDLAGGEYQRIQGHPGVGARILEPISAYTNVIPMILQHHERFDGKGYPDALVGKELSLGARILAVADVYDAMISDRPYRTGMELKQVIELVKKEAGQQFDPKVVQAFLEVVGETSKAS